MVNNDKNKKHLSEIIPFDISELSTLQYIKMIFLDENKEVCEIRAEDNSIYDDIIRLYINGAENINIECPTGVVLKFIISNAIYFAKAILNDIKYVDDRFVLTLTIPQKTIRQQKRKFSRVNINRYCILSVSDGKDNYQTFIAQSVNISKGGILLNNLESIFNDKKIKLKLSQGNSCYITMFLEHDLKVKTLAKFVRLECVDNVYRYAFEFFNMSQQNIIPFDKYMTNQELELLKESL